MTAIDPRTAAEIGAETAPAEPAPFTVTTDQSALLAGLKAVMPAVSKRPPVPVLAGVKLEAGLDGLTLTGFDFEVEVKHHATGTGTGSVLVPAAMLLDLVKDLGKGCPITLSMDGLSCVIEGDGVRYTLLSMPIAEYPAMTAVPDDAVATFTDEAVAALVDVAGFASRDRTLPVLTHVQVALVKGGSVTARSTDRYRLAEYRYDAVVATDQTLLLDSRYIEMMPKVFGKGSSVDLALKVTPTPVGSTADPTVWVQLRNGTTTMTFCSATDMDFPKVASLFPDHFTTVVTLDADALSKGLKQVAKVLRRNAPVRFSVHPTSVLLTGGDDNVTASKPIETLDVTGPTWVSTGFNPGFLTDALKALDGDVVNVAMPVPGDGGTSREALVFVYKPSVLSNPDRPGFRVLQMPVRMAG